MLTQSFPPLNSKLFWTHPQVLGFGVEVLGPAFKRHVAAWRAAALAMLDRCQEALEGSPEAAGGEGSPSEDGQPAAPMWQEAYFTLTSAEKLFQKLPELVLSAQFQVRTHVVICL